MPQSDMTRASRLQRTIIDDHRHEQCGHPPTMKLDRLTFLSCHRCGMMYVDGRVKQIDVILKENEKEGEEHVSSYATDDNVVHVLMERVFGDEVKTDG